MRSFDFFYDFRLINKIKVYQQLIRQMCTITESVRMYLEPNYLKKVTAYTLIQCTFLQNGTDIEPVLGENSGTRVLLLRAENRR